VKRFGKGSGWSVVTLLCATTLWPALAGTTVHEAPKRGGTLRLATAGDIRSVDPTVIYSMPEGILAMMLHRPLLDYDENERLVPMLAEDLPSISPDGLTYKFRLKPGVLFSNGREVVAEDVAYSLERHLDPRSAEGCLSYYLNIQGAAAFRRARSNELWLLTRSARGGNQRWLEPTNVAGLRASNRYTLEIQLNQPDLVFSDIMARPLSVVLPREEVERVDKRFGQHPIGCGPFVLKEWKRGVELRLERNPHYFLPGRPYLDAVELLIGVDESTQIMMFERGELDWVSSIPDPDYLRLKRHPRYHHCIELVEGNDAVYISLNCELPPFTDQRVRWALNYAVNKEHLLKVLLHRGVIARGVLPNSIKGFNPNLPGYPFDPEKAKALPAEAGYTNSRPIRFLVASDSSLSRKIAAVIEQDMRKVGVKLDLKEVSFLAQLNEGQRRGNVPMAVWDWVSNINDPKDMLDLNLNGERITEEECANAAFYCSPRVNGLFRQAAPEMDAARRLRLYQELERIVAEDAPWIFLCNLNYEALCQPWLKGFKVRAVWPQRLENAWLDK
jgi:ABC-type transport system substrate-binding protein